MNWVDVFVHDFNLREVATTIVFNLILAATSRRLFSVDHSVNLGWRRFGIDAVIQSYVDFFVEIMRNRF